MLGKSENEKPELVFDDLTVGKEFSPLPYHVTEELVERFIAVVGDDHPFYRRNKNGTYGSLGHQIAPPGLAAIYARQSYLQDHVMPTGGVLAKQEFEFLKPILIGETLTVRARVVERCRDEKNRMRVTFNIRAFNPREEQVSEIRLYAIWPK